MILTKKADTHLDLDIAKMQEQSSSNPVFYVQYAHARCCSVLRAAKPLFSLEKQTMQAMAMGDFSDFADDPLLMLLVASPFGKTNRESGAKPELFFSSFFSAAFLTSLLGFLGLSCADKLKQKLRMLKNDMINFIKESDLE
jgi:hypothetical protein